MSGTHVSATYDHAFYQAQIDGSRRSAAIFARIFLDIYRPRSVIDFGCGRGTWLQAFHELGAERLVGVDGAWNDGQMADPAIRFVAQDLEHAAPLGERFDLAMSLEVAEHVSEAAAEPFVDALCRSADLVIFSAAAPDDGGDHHVNEQPASYWAAKFVSRGFRPYDLFRPIAWDQAGTELWYRQNAFCYANDAGLTHAPGLAGRTIEALGFMDIRHPDLIGVKQQLRNTFSTLKRKVRRRH